MEQNKYGRLTIIGEPFRRFYTEKSKKKATFVLAICDCGNVKEYSLNHLKTKHTQSCGCLDFDKKSERKTTHGLSKHPLHKVWCNIKERCYNPNKKQFKDYGGRGIKVCDEWKNDFQAFYDYCVLHGWKKQLEVDRFPDKNGNYEPGNIRFATSAMNNQNRRDNVITLQRAKHVRILHKYSGRNYKSISELYGISKDVVGRIVLNKSWVC